MGIFDEAANSTKAERESRLRASIEKLRAIAEIVLGSRTDLESRGLKIDFDADHNLSVFSIFEGSNEDGIIFMPSVKSVNLEVDENGDLLLEKDVLDPGLSAEAVAQKIASLVVKTFDLDK